MAIDNFIQLQTNTEFFPQVPATLHTAEFNITEYHDIFFTDENILFPDNIQRAVTKRKAEYFAGRYLAKQAFAQHGIKAFDLRSDPRRCPLWPNGLVGSISHTKNIAICAIAEQTRINALGIDLEFWIKKQSENLIKSTVINPQEEQLLKGSGLVFNQALTLIFSAKESLFKALYPQVGCYFDFSAALLTNIDKKQQKVELMLCENLGSVYQANQSFQVHYVLSDDFALTLVEIKPAKTVSLKK